MNGGKTNLSPHHYDPNFSPSYCAGSPTIAWITAAGIVVVTSVQPMQQYRGVTAVLPSYQMDAITIVSFSVLLDLVIDIYWIRMPEWLETMVSSRTSANHNIDQASAKLKNTDWNAFLCWKFERWIIYIGFPAYLSCYLLVWLDKLQTLVLHFSNTVW
jgi:hypothetical protein